NVAEYEALLVGLRLALTLNVKELRIIGDSQLILRQVLVTYRTRDERLKQYQSLVRLVAKQFRKLTYVHTLRSQNVLADSLASSLKIPLDKESETIVIKRMDFPSTRDPWFEKFARVELMEEIMSFWEDEVPTIQKLDEEVDDGNPWYFDIENLCRNKSFPEYATRDDRIALARIAQRYKII